MKIHSLWRNIKQNNLPTIKQWFKKYWFKILIKIIENHETIEDFLKDLF